MPGDAAVALLKAGAEADKRDADGQLALDLAPDKEVRLPFFSCYASSWTPELTVVDHIGPQVYRARG